MKVLIVGIALASALMGQDAPQRRPQPNDGPSLKETMKFIQDKLPGKVNYIVYWHNNVTGTDETPTRSSMELDNVSTDADHCSIRYHFRNNLVDLYDLMYLKEVREITLLPLDRSMQQLKAKAGHPEESAKVDPPIFLVVVSTEKHPVLFSFYDQTMSERVTKALQHAVHVCGGGGSPDPF